MRTDIGRFFEGRLLDTIKLLQTIYDVGCGAGRDVNAWVDGRELVFSRGEESKGRGFLRVTPGETNATICFPRGHELLDPLKRAKGPRGSETRMTIMHPSELDSYVRRMIDAAYELDR
jgi:hypothetical protein